MVDVVCPVDDYGNHATSHSPNKERGRSKQTRQTSADRGCRLSYMGIDISMNSNTLPPILRHNCSCCLWLPPTNPPDKTPQSFFFSSLLLGGPHDDQIGPDLGEWGGEGRERRERQRERARERKRDISCQLEAIDQIVLLTFKETV